MKSQEETEFFLVKAISDLFYNQHNPEVKKIYDNVTKYMNPKYLCYLLAEEGIFCNCENCRNEIFFDETKESQIKNE